MTSREKRPVIVLREAGEHNLKGFDLEIPHYALIAISGVSGSGKSSLAFDTLFREGERRYLETFSSYARQFLGRAQRPQVSHISGMAPAIAIHQRSIQASARSTVGTLTGIYDHLRLLLARLGQARCPGCGMVLEQRSVPELADSISQRSGGQDLELYSVLLDGHRGASRSLLARARQLGFEKIRIDGQIYEADWPSELSETQTHCIDLQIARFDPARINPEQLVGLLEKALGLGIGAFRLVGPDFEERFSTRNGCSQCGAGFPEMGSRLFSFNSPYGACPQCKGLGVMDVIAPELLIADPSRSLRQGALVPTTPNGYIVYSQVTVEVLDLVCRAHGFSVDIPWQDLSPEQQAVIFYGSDRLRVPFGKHPLENRLKWSGITARPREEGYYKGLLPTMEETLKRDRNNNILRFVSSFPCSHCQGSRLRPEALAVTLQGQNVQQLTAMNFSRLGEWLRGLALKPEEQQVAEPIVAGLLKRIEMACMTGLGYLSAHRESGSLSGGESQRIRLISQPCSDLGGVLYVMDEPGLGLHPGERQQILQVLRDLQARGNTVIMVDHDLESLGQADWLIDLGPGAGSHGGQLLFSGPPELLAGGNVGESPTGSFLRGDRKIPVPEARRPGTGILEVRGARANNLKNLNLRFKLGALNLVSGVSGSGKSSLVEHILARALRRLIQGKPDPGGAYDRIDFSVRPGKVITIDQKPIGRSPRSNPLTYTGLFDDVRAFFANLAQAKAAGLGKGHFSFNVKGGRCEACQGAGMDLIGMHGLNSVEILCELCNGRRFRPEVLEIRYKDHNICDVLDLTLEAAARLFSEQKAIKRQLDSLISVGLGYLSAGQSAMTLSGGEAQRVKLAAELGRPAARNTLYLLDEPTAGLHPADIGLLLEGLNRLVERGDTVILVEHQLDMIKSADYLIDLGPGSGEHGGELVACGTPEEVARMEHSKTGSALAVLFGWRKPPERSLPRSAIQAGPLVLEGVRTHNLRGFDLSIPAGRLTLITGVSGSGKSSLAFDTIHAEGRRRFAEHLSTRARRFLSQSLEARVNRISGLTPTIAVSQKVPANNPRSTVGTMTEIYHYYRLLYARAGEDRCSNCQASLPCPACNSAPVGAKTASMFSFNHHQGACPGCGGTGKKTSCDPARLITDAGRSLLDGAMSGHKTGAFYGDPMGQHLAILRAVGQELALDFELPWRQLSQTARTVALYGTAERCYKVTWAYQRGKRAGSHQWETPWKGFCAYVDEEYERKRANKKEDSLRHLMAERPCSDCGGSRLKARSAVVRFANLTIQQLCELSVKDSISWLTHLEKSGLMTNDQTAITADIRKEVLHRLTCLARLGLGYLNQNRAAADLSGGEAQRVKLAAALGSGLRGVTYVLDEPTVGLHHRDTQNLLGVLRDLQGLGNSLVVVEHDEDLIRAADFVIELGPGAGARGGHLVFQGSPEQMLADSNSLTGAWLSGRQSLPEFPPAPGDGGRITFHGACANNLDQIGLAIPTGKMTLVTGVSGSGKTSLIFAVIGASAAAGKAVNCLSIQGLDAFDRVLLFERKPLGNSPISCPATLLGIYDPIRNLFAATESSKAKGLSRSHFAFTSRGGRCESCKGLGRTRTELDFLPDVWSRCQDCQGRRFQGEVLGCLYRGHSIADILELSISDARQLFHDAGFAARLAILEEVGLGHLLLGQGANQLSGGEALRMALAIELLKGSQKACLFLLDEPTTGLHAQDVSRLLVLLRSLVDSGHTLIISEHHPGLIQRADFQIELGPEGGEAGGRVLYAGPPQDAGKWIPA